MAQQADLSGWLGLQLALIGGPAGGAPSWEEEASSSGPAGRRAGSPGASSSGAAGPSGRQPVRGDSGAPVAEDWRGGRPRAAPPSLETGGPRPGAGTSSGGLGGSGDAAANSNNSGSGSGGGGPDDDEAQYSPAVRAALAMLKFYRQGLSPLMQSTCRFLPTCSNYSIDSYKKFGVWKGTVLTAWRLLRCNPWGGDGYDPAAWPPVGLAPLFGWEYSPQVAVVAGAALIVRLGHALLFE